MISSIKQYFSQEMKYIVPGVILAIVLASIFSFATYLITSMAAGPLYRTSDAADCRIRYAHATTQAETTAVDFRPYADSVTKRRTRCGMLRAQTLSTF